MISPADLHRLGIDLIMPPSAGEVDLRRGISTLYYGVFHRLTSAASQAFFGRGGAALTRQAARAFNHGAMRQVCEGYVRSPKRPFPPPLDHLMQSPPEAWLVDVASAFARLQEARHKADYDIGATFERTDALDLLTQAEFVHFMLDGQSGHRDLAVFLTALLLADRWTRRG